MPVDGVPPGRAQREGSRPALQAATAPPAGKPRQVPGGHGPHPRGHRRGLARARHPHRRPRGQL